MTLRDTLSGLRHALDGPPALQAVRGWVEMGAPEVLEPVSQLVRAASKGPSSVELTREEAGAIGAALDAYLPKMAVSGKSASVQERLVQRGILLRGRDGLILAPDFLWTVGLAAWAGRALELSGGTTDDGHRQPVEFRLAGERVVRVAVRGGVVHVGVVTPAEVAAELASRVASSKSGSARDLEVRCTWKEGHPVDYELKEETVTVAFGPDGARWAVAGTSAAAPERLADAEVADRLRATVGRGADFDARAVALGRMARSRRYSLVRPAQLIPAVDVATMLWPGAEDRLVLLEMERQRQGKAESYWRAAPSFVQGK